MEDFENKSVVPNQRMFETQDMLPRQPPMPSAPVNELSLKPCVPEVSILVEKPATASETVANQIPLSYAAWKKQNLPRVTFPPNLSDEGTGYITRRSNVFPFRTVTITSTPTTCTTSLSSVCSSEKPCRHALEDPRILTLASSPTSNLQFTSKGEQKRSLESSQRSQVTDAVLTICASTQTDAYSTHDAASVFFNQELNQLTCIIRELREDQYQMRQILKTLLPQNQQTQQMHVYYKDKSTQYESENGKNILNTPSASLENLPPFNIESGTLHRALPNVKIYSPVTNDTSDSVVPVVQSPTYRSNPIGNIRQNGQQTNQYMKSVPILPKSSTERSMVMNELAMKYLPPDKLTEMMHDTQITTGVTPPSKKTMPLHENDNFNKAPTDISNASYKYLRKYRLLPNQNQDSSAQNGKLMPPYQQRMPNSATPCSNVGDETAHLDLEHIRRQPKFL